MTAPSLGSGNTDVEDSSNNSFHGTIFGGVSLGEEGIIGSAAFFDGTNDYIELDDNQNGDLDFGASTDFLVSTWIKTIADSSSNTHNIVSTYTGGADPGFSVFLDNNVLRAFIRDDLNNIVMITGSTIINDGEWHHIVARFDRDGSLTIFLDGKEIGVINSPCYSHRMGKSLALAHIQPGIPVGSILKVTGENLETIAKVVQSPIYDPQKTRTHA